MKKGFYLFLFLFLFLVGKHNIAVGAATDLHDNHRSAFTNESHHDDALIKFFVIKPMGRALLKKAFRTGSYSIQSQSVKHINRAIDAGYDVVLIFSILNAKGYQAAASINHRIEEIRESKRAIAQLSWIGEMGNLSFKNVDEKELNIDRKIFEAKDGQEISPREGMIITGLLAPQSCHVRGEFASLGHDSDVNNASADVMTLSFKLPRIGHLQCSACKAREECLMSGKGAIQFFPCEDVLCRSCIEALSLPSPNPLPNGCPLCQ